TAKDIWQNIPGEVQFDSVHLATYRDNYYDFAGTDGFNMSFWKDIMILITEVNKCLENVRKENKIGAPLEAEVKIYCSSEWAEKLNTLQDELRFVLITSYASVHPLSEKHDNAQACELKD